MHSNIFDRLSFYSLFFVVVLLPIFCLPFTTIPVETSKGLLLVLGLTACVVFWALARFSDGKVSFPKSWLLVSGFGVAFVFLLSSLLSANSQVSLFGTMFDTGSFWFIFAGFILMLFASMVFRTPQQAKMVLLGMILSSAFVLIFQSLHLFMPTILSLGILTEKTGNIFGSWNALGLFVGFSSLMFLLVIEFFPISQREKLFLEIFILLSILLAAAVNFPLVWVLLGISSLIIFVYKISIALQKNREEGEKRHFPIISFVIVIISLLFFLAGPFIGGFIPSRLGITNNEVGPSLNATASIIKEVVVKNPVLGIGPNRFGEAWSMYKPASVNNTQFWNTTFDSGSGLLPTLFATTGGLGILAWIIFFVLFLITGAKSVFSSIKSGTNWEMMAFFILSLYLFVSSFFYSTGPVTFFLSLAFTGVFIGLAASNSNKEKTISFLEDHRKSFFSILVLILLVIFSVGTAFKYVERFVSISYFGKAVFASTEPIAEDSITKALSLYPNDLYLRTLSQVFLIKLNTIASKATKSSPLSDVDKADLQNSFNQAVNSAQLATTYNSSNYINFQLLGSVYQAVGALGVKDAYSKAVEAYKNASTLNPLNPGLKLSIAGVLLVDGKIKDAKDYANEALSLKQDYVDALITLSQIAKSEGNTSAALSYAQTALSFVPTTDKNFKQYADYVDSLNSSSSPTTVPASTTISTPAPVKK